MINPLLIFLLILLYMTLLFLLALRVEKSPLPEGKNLADHPLVYALSLAAYCTAWTFYGCVGLATTSGLLFWTFYLGPMLSILLWWVTLRRMVRIRAKHRITSIADFISARYRRSRSLAVLVTAGALVGVMPYIALQLKSIINTSSIIFAPAGSLSFFADNIAGLIVILMILFTIVFGLRYTDPKERHRGIVMVVAVQSIVKLIAFMAVGIFVTYFLYDGFQDIFERMGRVLPHADLLSFGPGTTPYVTWMSYLILSMSAVIFLPRQFHLAVVETSHEKQILPAMWIFPLYMMLIAVFITPIAIAGLLMGLPPELADSYVLWLPLMSEKSALALLVFMGGFSAATSMIMICTMTLATMFTNHICMPMIEGIPLLRFLRRRILACRWAAATGIILVGYWFERQLGESYMLGNMGIISFAAAIQFAPAILAGIFWRRANKTGALLGMGSGFAVWLYTMLMPAFIKSGWLSESLLHEGPLGIAFLRPEQLFLLSGLSPVSHTLFWSMLFNIGFLSLGSLFFRQTPEESAIAESFTGMLTPSEMIRPKSSSATTIKLSEKLDRMKSILLQYFSPGKTEAMVERCVSAAGLEGRSELAVLDLSRLADELEKSLTGSFGSASAHGIVRRAGLFRDSETEALQEEYSRILATLHMPPEELRKRIDFQRERETLLSSHARELEDNIALLNLEIKERKKAEKALRESQYRYRDIFEGSMDAIYITARDGTFIDVNPAMETLFGYEREELLGMKAADTYLYAADRLKFQDEIHKKGFLQDYELTLCRKDGKAMECLLSATVKRDAEGRITGYQGIIRNITEQRKLQAQFQQAQRMEAIGTLAGGVAHDFNNLLMAIQGRASLIMVKGVEPPSAIEHLKSIENHVSEAAELTGQLLGIARGGKYNAKPTDLNKIVENQNRMFGRTRKEITIHGEYTGDLHPVEADRGQIGQVLLNIYVNASQAMPHGGELFTRTENVVLNRAQAESYNIQPGRYVKISIRDTGTGMDEDTMHRIFDPFYTTKERGRGTGLGLASAYGIIKNHGGHIDVKSRQGEGSTFMIFLPAMEIAFAHKTDRPRDSYKGEGTVLLVDDEEIILEIGTRILQEMGYKVITASGGVKALEIYRKNRDTVDIVILDLVMPGMGGSETFDRLRELDPGVKVLLYSGYSIDGQVQEILKKGCNGFLQKPFDMKELSTKICEVLEIK